MSTYTESLGLELITPGSQAGLWGNTTNNTFTLIDQAITGVTPLSFASASGTTITLTDYNGAEDEARSAVLNITGSASGANTVVIPNKQKTYLVRNNTGQDVTFQTPSPTASYTVGAGYSILIFCDGNNNVFTGIASPGVGTLSVNAGGTGATTFTAGFIKSTGGTNALTSSATVNAATELSGATPVVNGGTGQTSLTSGAVLLGNGTGAVSPTVGGASGQVLTWNGSAWAAATPASAGVTSISGSNIGVSPATGPVTITLSGSNVTSALGYTPANVSSLSNYAALSGASFSGNVTTSAGMYSTGGFYFGSGYSSNIYYNTGASGVSITASGAAQFTFANSGSAFATAWVNTSDARVKENITPLDSALSKVTQLNPVRFSMKSDNLSAPNKIGLLAQDLELIYPEVVSDSKTTISGVDNVKGVSYSDLVPVLIKAIQELKAEVDALKAAK